MILQATSVQLMTSQALLTTGSAILAVVVISNTVFHVSGWKSRWFSLILSIILAYTIYQLGIKDQQKSFLINFLLIIINGCLIYTSAFGLQNNVIVEVPAIGQTGGGTPGVDPTAPLTPKSTTRKITFFGKW